MNADLLRKDLIRDEGLRLKLYQCPAGKMSIGVGRNIEDNGIREDEAMYLLNNDIAESLRDCISVFGDEWGQMNDVRQRAFCNLRFSLGPGTFRKFKATLRAAKEQDWAMCAHHLKNSRWYGQVGDRAKRIVNMILKGEE